MTDNRIEVTPRILAGKPVIKGTRIPVSLILNLVRHGYTVAKIHRVYPELSAKDVEAALAYGENRIDREAMTVVSSDLLARIWVE